MDPNQSLSQEAQIYTRVASYLIEAAQLIHPINSAASLMLAHQANAFIQMSDPSSCDCQGTCGCSDGFESTSPEVAAEVDSLVSDIEAIIENS